MPWLDRAKAVIATGSSTLSKRSRSAVEGVSPPAFISASGAHFLGVDGREYLDWTQALGAGLLGYANPAITMAISDALIHGCVASVPSTLEVEAAEALIAASPYAEQSAMVKWLNSGTEACQAAIRIARRATGRSNGIVLSSGYHGWMEPFMCLQPMTDGIPDAYRQMVGPLDLCKPINLGAGGLLDTLYVGDAAAVILEPAVFSLMPDGYLAALKLECSRSGALLIFDEVVTGFRFPPGMVTQGVVPDLTIYGKSLSGGLPCGVVVGPAEIMRYSDVISGTFCGNAAVMAAVLASLAFCARYPVTEHIEAIGTALLHGLKRVATDSPLSISGLPQRMRLSWPDDEDFAHRSLVVQGLARRGIHMNQAAILPGWAHQAEDVERTLEAFAETLQEIADGAELKGLPIMPAFARR